MDTATRPGRHTRPSAKRSLKSALWAPVALGEFLLAGYATTSTTALVLVVGGAIVTVLCFLFPIAMMIMVFPATFGYWRVGPAAAGMSITDLLAMLGTVAVLPYVPWQSPAFKRALLATAMYAVMIGVTDIAHPTKATIAETGHRFILVMGAICIGAALARLGRAQLAMRVMLASSAVVAVVAVYSTFSRHLQPGSPLGMQKNSAGVLLTMSFVMLFTGARVLALPRWLAFVLGGLLLAGLAPTQSRGSRPRIDRGVRSVHHAQQLAGTVPQGRTIRSRGHHCEHRNTDRRRRDLQQPRRQADGYGGTFFNTVGTREPRTAPRSTRSSCPVLSSVAGSSGSPPGGPWHPPARPRRR